MDLQPGARCKPLQIMYKVVQIWPGLFVCKQVTVCPGHIWNTLYNLYYTNYTKFTPLVVICPRGAREQPRNNWRDSLT
jgi:hypothetical protein